MWLIRNLEKFWKSTGLPVKVILGVRQCGKTALLHHLGRNKRHYVTLDDLQARQLADKDPALFFDLNPSPLTLDEAQYSPNLFPEIKKRVDESRLQRQKKTKKIVTPSLWMTGSNQILMKKNTRESLAGRAEYYKLHTLSVNEILESTQTRIADIFIRGGWPELYVDSSINPSHYLNDYISTFIEKDILSSAGIQKSSAFTKTLSLLAARTATSINASEIASVCSVAVTTILDWISILETNMLIGQLPAFHTNLNKRLIKTPRLYFMDVGLASRLQGWHDIKQLQNSPQIGLLFETLVYEEIIKTRDHHRKDWNIFYWRTKEGEEIDFIIATGKKYILLESKMATQSVKAIETPKSLYKIIPQKQVAVVTFGGTLKKLSENCQQVPISYLRDYLLEQDE